ncbi:ead/Ea22-like family protein [Citrobacter sp. CK198]|uniref:ead/Ea22-like family protein n=1 Tax=Citrobacter sp. CK198 TaxID=2985107 RepID=UPI00257657F8|nr:ead/Ea22-like family protein [Citrobacter sp. CK198]MDM2973280.1 ead/Ea22-like family protein [Citrobacter sp. CK198]
MSNIDKRALREAADGVLQKYGSEWFETGSQLCTVHKSKIELIAAANPATVLALLDDLEAAAKRLAELEARTVTLPENITSANAPEVFEISAEAERLGLRGTYASYAVGWNARGIADKEALREAGVKVAAAGKGEAS